MLRLTHLTNVRDGLLRKSTEGNILPAYGGFQSPAL